MTFVLKAGRRSSMYGTVGREHNGHQLTMPPRQIRIVPDHVPYRGRQAQCTSQQLDAEEFFSAVSCGWSLELAAGVPGCLNFSCVRSRLNVLQRFTQHSRRLLRIEEATGGHQVIVFWRWRLCRSRKCSGFRADVSWECGLPDVRGLRLILDARRTAASPIVRAAPHSRMSALGVARPT